MIQMLYRLTWPIITSWFPVLESLPQGYDLSAPPLPPRPRHVHSVSDISLLSHGKYPQIIGFGPPIGCVPKKFPQKICQHLFREVINSKNTKSRSLCYILD